MSEYIYGTDGHEGHWLTGEEIIRCRDCEHYREEYEECMRGLPSGNVVIFDCESHDFCSFGKRKKVDA